MFPASTPGGRGGIARAAAMETKVGTTHTGHFFRFNIRLRVYILLFFLSVWGKLPGLIFFKGPFWGAYFWRDSFSEGLINGGKFACFKIDWASLACSGKELTIFALFYLVFQGKFQVQASQGAYIRRGDLTEGFLRYDFGGLIFGGAYTWRGLFSEFYGSLLCSRF